MMKKLLILLAVSATVVTGASSCNEKNKENTCYSCPMHPDAAQSKPGTCPHCGMNMEKCNDMEKCKNMGSGTDTTKSGNQPQ